MTCFLNNLFLVLLYMLPFASRVILDKSLHLPGIQFSPLWSGDNNSTYLIKFGGWLNEVVSVESLEECLAHGKHHVSVIYCCCYFIKYFKSFGKQDGYNCHHHHHYHPPPHQHHQKNHADIKVLYNRPRNDHIILEYLSYGTTFKLERNKFRTN